MTAEHAEDETLAWAREMAADLKSPSEQDDDGLRVALPAPGTADPEADVLAAMAQLPEDWKRHVADIAQGIAEEVAEQPEALPSTGPSTGRHHSPAE